MYDYVKGDGPVPCDLMVVAEAPAETECQTGIPLTGKTGQEFNNLLKRFIGRDREEVYVTNLYKFPLNEKKEVSWGERDWMGEVLRDEISRVNPMVILLLGGISTRWFLGDLHEMESLNAVPHKWEGRIVVPSIHPAAMFKPDGQMGGSAILSWVIEAFEKTREVIEGKAKVQAIKRSKVKIEEDVFPENFDTIAIDTEAYADGEPYLVTFSPQKGKAGYVYSDYSHKIDWLWDVTGKCLVVLHNALYDLPQLWKVGIYPTRWVDTMQIAFLLETLPLGLKPLAYRLLGLDLRSYEEVVGDKRDLSEVPEHDRLSYACGDAEATLRVYSKLKQLYYPRIVEVLNRDMDIQPMILAMMERGMKIDKKYIEEVGKEFETENSILLGDIRGNIGDPDFNPKSAKQVSELVYKKLALGKRHKVRRTKWGGATDARTLKKIEGEHPLVSKIMQYRARKDLIDKYINVLPAFGGEDGRIHADISMVRVTQSGRLACSNPNLLAQPVRSRDGRRLRDGFMASEGYSIVSMDYNQIEMRLMAHLSQDPVMMEVYNNGGDIHTDTAMRTFKIARKEEVDEIKHRYPSKRTGFGVIYRITAMGLSVQLMGEGLMEWGEDKCQWLIDSWLREHPGVEEFWRKTDAETRRNRMIFDLWGRRKLIPEVVSVYPYIQEAGLRKATNVPEQSGAQGIIKEAMRRIWRQGGSEWYEEGIVYPLIQIHDDITSEVRDDFVSEYIRCVKPMMENVVELSVPITVECKVGKRWGSQDKVWLQL